jgi:formylglycine-generating enzyme required for sulfatase activity
MGETISPELANYESSLTYGNGRTGKSRGETTPVNHYGVANGWGLCDMHGNVWEWCQEHWHENYKGAPKDGRAWLSDDSKVLRVNRGGSWFNYPWFCRSAYRGRHDPGYRNFNLGFRVACSAPQSLRNPPK